MTDSPSVSKSILPSRSWLPSVAGAIAGFCGAVVTAPFDVVKTRLQSDLFHQKRIGAEVGVLRATGSGTATVVAQAGAPRVGGALWHFIETGYILRDIYRNESPRALFKGLGPTLVAIVPARAINFFSYDNGKKIIANQFNNGKESPYVHLPAAAVAGIATGTLTNPIWVIKTRLQLTVEEATAARKQTNAQRVLNSSVRVAKDIWRQEGFRGYYKGLTASYLGITEGVIQWVLYEEFKKVSGANDGRGGFMGWLSTSGSGGAAKFIASLVTYPHEVLRTRLRQPRVDGVLKYTGLMQTLRLVIKEEGARALYSGLTPHLMRVVPNAAILFTIYEGVMRTGRT